MPTNQWTCVGESKMWCAVPDLHECQHHQAQNRIPWWLWPHVLSLEAPLVAVLWQTVVAHAHHIALQGEVRVGLALVVWLVYVADRLFDAANAAAGATDARHAFYRRHWRGIALGAVPVAAVAVVWLALWRIPAALMWQCVAVALLVAIYLACFPARRHRRLVGVVGGFVGLGVVVAIFFLPMPLPTKMQFAMIGALLMTFSFFHRADVPAGSRLPKEPLASLLFALGCSAGVQFASAGDGAAGLTIDIGLLWLAFGMNMLGIAAVEREAGQRDADSVATAWPLLPRLYPVLVSAGIVACAVVIMRPERFPARADRIATPAGAALVLLFVLWCARRRFSSLSYRVLADVAVALPALRLL